MTTYTLSTVSLPVTRGRAFTVGIGAVPLSVPGSKPVDLNGAELSGYLSWGFETEQMVLSKPHVGYKLVASPEQTHNLPMSRASYFTLTIIDTLGDRHDLVFPLSVNLVPNL